MRARWLAVLLFVIGSMLASPAPASATVAFTEPATSEETAGDSPHHLTSADLNGDGKNDLAVVNRLSDDLTVHLGGGSGDFTLAGTVSLPDDPDDVQPADIDKDGDVDLIVTVGAGQNKACVLLNDGSAVFTHAPESPIAVAANPNRVAIGDLDNDSYLDFVIAATTAATFTVFINDGDTTFTALPSESAPVGVLGVSAVDFDLDGDLDVVGASLNSSAMSVLLNDGTGDLTIASGSPIAIDNGAGEIDTGFLNDDVFPDVVTASSVNRNVRVWLGQGDGQLAEAASGPTTLPAAAFPDGVVVSDIDGDGIDDVAASTSSGGLHVLTSDDRGDLTAAGTFGLAGFGADVVAEDFEGDGDPDLAITNQTTDNLTILLNTVTHGDVSIVKSDSGGFVPVGENFTYTFTVKNEDPNTATGIVVTDQLPTEDVAYVSDDGGCTHDAGHLSCPVPDLDEDETHVITVTVTALEACFPLNRARVRSNLFDDNLADNVDSEESILIAKASIGNARRVEGDGGSTTFRFKVSLNSPATGGENVLYKTRLGSASASDIASKQGLIVFAPGEQSKTVRVRVAGDTKVETNETFFVDLYDELGLFLEDASGRGVIVNDDTGGIDGCPGQCT